MSESITWSVTYPITIDKGGTGQTTQQAASITFWLPLDPVPWARPRMSRRTGHFFTQANVEKYVSDFRKLAKEHLPKVPLEGPLSLSLVFQFLPPKRKVRDLPHVKPDLDNFVKAAVDAMNPKQGWPGFWVDDGQIVYLIARKRYGRIPFVWVQISNAEADKEEAIPCL